MTTVARHPLAHSCYMSTTVRVPCANLDLYTALFKKDSVCHEAYSTQSCTTCSQSLCSNCAVVNHHACYHKTHDDEVNVLTHVEAMVTWTINRLNASNKFIQTIRKTKASYQLTDLLVCKENPNYTDAACSYWGRLAGSGQLFTCLIDSINVGSERANSKRQLVLSIDSNFDPELLIPAIMAIVKKKPALQEVIFPC